MQKASVRKQSYVSQVEAHSEEGRNLVALDGRRTVLWAKYEDELDVLAEARQKMGRAEELCNRLGFHLNAVKERMPSR